DGFITTSTEPLNCWSEGVGALGTPSALVVTNSEWVATSGFGNTGGNPGIKTNVYGADDNWVISPAIDLGGVANTYRVSYRMSVTGWNNSTVQPSLGGHEVHVIVSADGGSTWNVADIIATHTGAGTYTATTYTHNLTTQTGVVKVAFVASEAGTSPDVDLHIDDFIVEEIPPCVEPLAAAATDVLDETATINWVEPGDLPGIGYEFEVRESGAPGDPSPDAFGSETVGTATSAVTGLTANTGYTVYVRSYCSTGPDVYSAWATVATFSTACTPEVAPTVPETFDTYAGAAPDPDCWSESTGAIGTPSILSGTGSGWGVSTSFVNSPSDASARINLYSGTNEWLISQPIDLGASAGDYRVSFDMGARPYFGGAASTSLGSHEVSVIVSTDAGATWNAADVIATYTGAGTYDGSTVTIDLTAYSGVVKIAFVTNTFSFSPDLYFYVDDFFVEEIPTCFEPTALNPTNITIDGVDVSWTAPILGTVTGYEYEISTSATPTVGTPVAGTSVSGITGLMSGTEYYLHVRTACIAPGDFSEWTSITFTTLYENPFCDVDGVAIPDNGCGSSTYLEQPVLVSGITGLLGTDVIVNKCVINIAHTWDSDLDIILVSPAGTEVDLSLGNGGLGDNYGGNGCNVSPTVFSMDADDPITSGSAPFSGTFIPEGDFSAFDGEDPNGFWTLKICDGGSGDDGVLNYFRLQIIPPPTCFAPTGLVSSGITATTATVNWTSGTGSPGPSSYQFYYNTTGLAPDEFTVPTGTATGNSIYMNTLVPGTTYYFWVRSDCGIQNSDWSAQEEFTTSVENDLCEDAIEVVCGGTYNGDNTNATQQTIPGAPGTPGRGLWYVFTGNGGDVTFSLCNSAFFDSRINVLTGTCGSLTNVANNDDACSLMSEVTVSTVTGTEYYIYASNYSAATSGAPFVLDVSCGGFWTGNTDNDWSDAGNWSDNAVPGIGDNAVIPTSPAGGNFPLVLVGNETVNNLELQSGATLGIQDGASITVEGDAINNGTINVANSGSFVQETGSVLSGSGLFNVTKNGSGVYDYWSSPVVNGALGGYFAFNSANSTIDPADDDNDPGWYQASGAIPVGRGGAFYGAGTRTFTGVAHNGDYGVAVTDNPAPADDWDLLGNPYPSGISVSSVLASPALTGGLAFWDETSYATHNGLSGNPGGGGNTPTGTIGTCQGFMAFATGGTVTFNNAMRVADNNPNLFRLAQLQTLRLSAIPAVVTDPPFSQTTLLFTDDVVGVNEGLDAYDTPKLGVLDDISLFSYIDASEYSINTRGLLVADQEIPLGLNSASATSVTITIVDAIDLDNDNVYLEDRMMNVFTDLKAGDYTFASNAQLYTNRFFLHVGASAITGIEDELSAGMNAYAADEMLNVYSTNDVTGNLELLDMSGKVVMTHSNLSLGPNGIQLSLSGLSDGAYIVRVVGDDVNMSRKIVK
ncbi:proprotein convertase P-domain-containing protein, partial [Flavobacteriales bacterium]|nr:proprotein convertase P-domain-containing protein [Flavobacteriales bacterium]